MAGSPCHQTGSQGLTSWVRASLGEEPAYGQARLETGRRSVTPGGFQGAIFDVDGVLIGSSHQRASREALRELMGGERRGPYEVTQDQLARTVHYFLERTADGSSLSRVVHAWVLARLDPAHGVALHP